MCQNILAPNFHEKSFDGSRVLASEQTDESELLGAFLQLLAANARKKSLLLDIVRGLK
jgi:hypothetical protein